MIRDGNSTELPTLEGIFGTSTVKDGASQLLPRLRDMMHTFISKGQSRDLRSNGLRSKARNDAIILEEVGGIAAGQMHIITQNHPATRIAKRV